MMLMHLLRPSNALVVPLNRDMPDVVWIRINDVCFELRSTLLTIRNQIIEELKK